MSGAITNAEMWHGKFSRMTDDELFEVYAKILESGWSSCRDGIFKDVRTHEDIRVFLSFLKDAIALRWYQERRPNLDFGWIGIKDKLPEPCVDVLVYTVHDKMKIGRYYDRDDLPPGRFWSIAGRSGGIGTNMEVKPPLYWMKLPTPPNNKMDEDSKPAASNKH